jgi:hypothetical protein
VLTGDGEFHIGFNADLTEYLIALCDEPCKCSCLDLEFKIKKEASYNYEYKRAAASAALRLIRTNLARASSSSHSPWTTMIAAPLVLNDQNYMRLGDEAETLYSKT